MATSPIGSAASPSLNSDGATPPLRTKPPVVSPTPAPAADVIGQRGDRDAGGQGTAAYTAAVLGHNGTVRAQYHHEVGALRANPNTQSSEARSQIRAKYQAKSTPLAQALAKHIASSPGRLERLQQKSPAQLTVSASRSNGPIDSLGRAARIAGRGVAAVGLASAAYDIATSPAADRPRVAAESGGAMLGGLGAGAACEATAVAIGLPEAGVGGLVTGAIGAVVCSGIGGSIGAGIGDRLFDHAGRTAPNVQPGSAPKLDQR